MRTIEWTPDGAESLNEIVEYYGMKAGENIARSIFNKMNYLALKGEVSDFSLKNLSLDKKLSILRGFIPRNLCIGKRFALKGGVLHPHFPINKEIELLAI